jgi:prevent-host-death family protein
VETVNIHQAKTHLSRLIERVAKGGIFVIAKAGRPVAKIVPLGEAEVRPARRVGFMVGQFRVPPDFDRMGDDEIGALFGTEG